MNQVDRNRIATEDRPLQMNNVVYTSNISLADKRSSIKENTAFYFTKTILYKISNS